MRPLVGLFLLLSISAFGQRPAEVDSIKRELKLGWKYPIFRIKEINNNIETNFRFSKEDSALQYALVVHSPWRSGDTVVKYHFVKNELVAVDMGFKKIYIWMWFSDGRLLHKLEKKGWRVLDVQRYIDEGHRLGNRAMKLLRP